jgi:hypothetical protein
MPRRAKAAVLVVIGLALTPRPAAADPIMATLEGCVSVADVRLEGALWFATGTFQAVAFDDEEPGCAPTIAHPLLEGYIFDEDRIDNTLTAWLNLENLPHCGRRQYDVHYYLADGILDPLGLKSLVIDTGVPCSESDGSLVSGETLEGSPAAIAEPGALALWAATMGFALTRRRLRERLRKRGAA